MPIITPFLLPILIRPTRKWNTTIIDQPLLDRFQRLTGKEPHHWLRRGLFFSHRDFDKILNHYEKGEPFFLYTGRGPSSDSMHIGHTIPFDFTKWLQDAFDVPLVIMLTDDEKFLFKEGLTIEETQNFAKETAKDVLAFGFDPKKTFIFADFDYMGGNLYKNSIEFSKLLPFNQVRGAFGFDNSSVPFTPLSIHAPKLTMPAHRTNVGRIFFPSTQCAAGFATSYPEIWGDNPKAPRAKATAAIPCLIPCGIDQDPYFRLLRDNQHRMSNPSPKAALIHSKFLIGLQGAGGKMSASNPNSAIFMSDTPNQIKNKINKHAFSGGQATLEEHKKLGGNPDVDVPFQYLTYFLDDDAEIERIREAYKKGDILTGEMKQHAIRLTQQYVSAFQTRRTAVTDELMQEAMTPRKLFWTGNPSPTTNAAKQEPAVVVTAPLNFNGIPEASDAKPEGLKPERPGLGSRKTTYGVQGLSSYGESTSEALYPTRSHEEYPRS